MDAVIIYESLTGTTRRAAHLIGDGFYDHQIGTTFYNVNAIDADVVAAADLVILGSWTDGLLIVGQKPARKKKFRAIPELGGKKCFVYCTYAIHPGKTIEKLSTIATDRGATVLGGLTIRRDHLEQDTAAFVDGVVAAVV